MECRALARLAGTDLLMLVAAHTRAPRAPVSMAPKVTVYKDPAER